MDRNNGYRDRLESRKSWCKWTKHTTYGQHCKICLSAGSRLASKAEFGMASGNDLLENPDFTAADVAKRMERFLKRMMEEAGLASRKMRLRLIAPPAMQEGQWVDRPELLTESRNLGKEYKRIAKRLGIAFTDASGWEIPTIYDGVHFTEEGHRIFAENIRKELNI